MCVGGGGRADLVIAFCTSLWHRAQFFNAFYFIIGISVTVAYMQHSHCV